MTDSWLKLCERVDALLNRVALQTSVDTPADALAGAKDGVKELVKLLKVQPWPDIDVFAKKCAKAGEALDSADAIGPMLEGLQAEWTAYQKYLVGDDPLAEAKSSHDQHLAANQLVKEHVARRDGQPVVDAKTQGKQKAAEPVAAAPPPPAPIVEPSPVVLSEEFDSDAADLEVLRSDPELASMFIAEALDHLSSIEATVLQLEEAPDDQKLLNDVFRPFHTVKGNAGALGVKSVQEFAHKVENLLDLCLLYTSPSPRD